MVLCVLWHHCCFFLNTFVVVFFKLRFLLLYFFWSLFVLFYHFFHFLSFFVCFCLFLSAVLFVVVDLSFCDVFVLILFV